MPRLLKDCIRQLEESHEEGVSGVSLSLCHVSNAL